ncbi:MAG: type pilus assembly protein PilM [Acidimicrobiales bacterium]|nr:type pilus assembly protein PilM [Acidimicrobiales bacterium]
MSRPPTRRARRRPHLVTGRAVGLDIGTHAVRAVELAFGRDDATITRFGQVALPAGAVVDGEVVDGHAVATAIRRLWSECRFRTRRVIVGLANQRVIVRQAEVPALPEEDLRLALRYQAGDLVPFPIDDALLDCRVLEPVDVGEDEDPRVRILLVAAQRDMVLSMLGAVESAGLQPVLVDLAPFALLRTFDPDIASDGGAEALVCIGAGVTTVVVHEAGVPRFVRMLLVGGASTTEAIAAELQIGLDAAEELKRAGDARVDELVDRQLAALVDEVQGSLDYYVAQVDTAALRRVVVTGGGSLLAGLAERLQATVGAPVEVGHPLLAARVGRTGVPEARLIDAEPMLAVPIGLALAGRPSPGQGRPLSLLPDELAAARVERRRTALAGTGVVVLAGLLMAAWTTRAGDVDAQRAKARLANGRAAAIVARSGRQTTVPLATQVGQRRTLVKGALTDDVAWDAVLQRIAGVMPNDSWLVSFSATKGKSGTAVTFSGFGADQSAAARWLIAMQDVDVLSGLWLPQSTKSGNGVQFTSTATLTPAALTNRLGIYTGSQQ